MKPMLAAEADLKTLRYPLYASPKLDGVRCVVTEDGRLLSRSLKPIPNRHVNKLFGRKELAGLDGELISGPPTATDVYRRTVGDVRREDGEPDVRLYTFDRWGRTTGFEAGWVKAKPAAGKRVVVLLQKKVANEAELLAYEAECLEAGYEGLILRSVDGVYKFGRSTAKEQGMLKLKRFSDGEAEVLEVVEELHNANEAKKNELGRTARSSAKAGMVPTGRAGGLRVREAKTGVEFTIGTGLNDVDRDFLWKHRDKLPGSVVKYKSFHIGVKDKPRFPVYLGPREPWDMPGVLA